MAETSACFVFGSGVRHRIECVVACEEGIVTGGGDGEICIWMGSEFRISTVCALPEESKCLGLLILVPPPDLQAFFTTGSIILSLHSKSQLRLWSFTDGKCLKISNDLFSQHNQLEGLTKVSDFEIAVYGKNEVFIIDAYRMQSLKYFCTESKVFSISTHGSEVWAQTLDQLYLFNIQGEFDNSTELIIKNRIDSNFPVHLSVNSSFLAVGNKSDLQIYKKGENITMKKMGQEGVIEWLGWDLNGLIAICAGIVKFFRLEDVLRGFLEDRFKISVDSLNLGLETKGKFVVRNREIFFCEESCVTLFNLKDKNAQKWKIEFEEPQFPVVNIGEVVTARNILLGDEIFLAVGTDLGRVIVFSLFSESKQVFFYMKSLITFVYLHKATLVVSNSDQVLLFWSFSPVSGTIFHNTPEKTVEIWTSSIKLMIPFEFANEGHCENRWEDTLLGQTETGAVLLIDLEQKSIFSYFQALQFCVINAVLHVNLDYLALGCTNGHMYVFNMVSLTLEREIFGDAVFNFQVPDKSTKVDRFSVFLNGLISFRSQRAIKISFCYLNSSFFPVLFVDSEKLDKKNHTFIKKIRKIWECHYLNQGFCASSRELSFNLHSKGSLSYNSIKIVSFFQLYGEILQIPADLLQLLVFSLNPECKFRKALIRFCENSPSLNTSLHKTGTLIQKNTKPGKNLPKSAQQSSKLSLSEAILLAISIINCILHPPQHCNNFVQDVSSLLKCNSHEYATFACQMLESGSASLEHYITESQMPELVQSLLQSSLTYKKSSDNEYFYQALVTIGLLSLNTFISILINEIKNSNKGKLHHKIFFTIEHFVLKHFLQATSVIEELADFLLKSHELKTSLGSKRFSTDFSTVLETFVGLLPMTAHTPDTRFLICGLPTGKVLIYDFKTNKKWKPFKLFTTTISALDIKDSHIAAYSAQESFLKVIRMETSLFGLSSGDIKLTDQIPLPEIEPETGSYQEMIKTTKIRFTSKQSLLLFREDRREYKYTVKTS